MNRFSRTFLALALACAALFALLKVASADRTLASPSSPADDAFVYLPLISNLVTPAGAYYCYEYEFGLIWTSEAITLHNDGSSVYAYYPPYSAIVTGTWVYTPGLEEVGFTHFRWLTTTYQSPNRLWASQYLTHAGFEIAISCYRLE